MHTRPHGIAHYLRLTQAFGRSTEVGLAHEVKLPLVYRNSTYIPGINHTYRPRSNLLARNLGSLLERQEEVSLNLCCPTPLHQYIPQAVVRE